MTMPINQRGLFSPLLESYACYQSSISTAIFALLFSTATSSPGDLTCIQAFFFQMYREEVYDRRSQVTMPINRRGLFSPLLESYACYQSSISTAIKGIIDLIKVSNHIFKLL